MAVDRITRVNELLRREIGEVLFQVLSGDEIDLSCVAVTQVAVSRDLRNARVLVSIFGHEDERDRMLSRLRHKRVQIQGRLNRDLYLRYTPRLAFELDTSVEQGDRMLALLNRIEADAPTNPDEEPGTP